MGVIKEICSLGHACIFALGRIKYVKNNCSLRSAACLQEGRVGWRQGGFSTERLRDIQGVQHIAVRVGSRHGECCLTEREG